MSRFIFQKKEFFHSCLQGFFWICFKLIDWRLKVRFHDWVIPIFYICCLLQSIASLIFDSHLSALVFIIWNLYSALQVLPPWPFLRLCQIILLSFDKYQLAWLIYSSQCLFLWLWLPILNIHAPTKLFCFEVFLNFICRTQL